MFQEATTRGRKGISLVGDELENTWMPTRGHADGEWMAHEAKGLAPARGRRDAHGVDVWLFFDFIAFDTCFCRARATTRTRDASRGRRCANTRTHFQGVT